MERRWYAVRQPGWVDSMAYLINHYERKTGFFRWHDSGDLQDTDHLHKIMDVCEQTPTIKHWLPTRERVLVDAVLRRRKCPPNLTIRLSHPFVDRRSLHVTQSASQFNVAESFVSTDLSKVTCPAYKQGGKCGSCRVCWSHLPVTYPKH